MVMMPSLTERLQWHVPAPARVELRHTTHQRSQRSRLTVNPCNPDSTALHIAMLCLRLGDREPPGIEEIRIRSE